MVVEELELNKDVFRTELHGISTSNVVGGGGGGGAAGTDADAGGAADADADVAIDSPTFRRYPRRGRGRQGGRQGCKEEEEESG